MINQYAKSIIGLFLILLSISWITATIKSNPQALPQSPVQRGDK
jgi:hypothetical protein